jgi:cytochrome c oxidase cbb3-type subunit 3
MFSYNHQQTAGRKMNKFFFVITILMLALIQPVWAAGPPVKSSLSNPMVLVLLTFIGLMLIIIWMLTKILLGTAELKYKKRKAGQNIALAITSIIVLLFTGNTVIAQNATDASTAAAVADTTVAGMSASTFYILAGVVFLELMIILVLLFNIRGLLKVTKAKVLAAEAAVAGLSPKPKKQNWWERFNSLRPIEKEADLDLGHDYDGIRELDNKLPNWWVYGFYLTIAFAGIYLFRYHVAHSAPLSAQEYEIAVKKGDQDVQDYLKKKGDAVDENTVTLLTDAADLSAAKAIFTDPTKCAQCHRPDAGGNIGPNLTDDYWLHGCDIKSIFKTIKYGINAMPSWQNTFSNKQIAQLASYVKSLHGSNPANPKAPQGVLCKDDAVPTSSAKKDSVVAKP